MNKFISLLVENRRFTLFIFAILVLVGLASYILLPRQEFPDSSLAGSTILTIYPGASAKDVHDLVSNKIEERLKEIDGYDYSSSVSKDSVSFVLVEFDLDTDADIAMQQVRNKIADLKDDLPENAYISNINTDVMETGSILLSLSGEDFTNTQLNDYAKNIKEKLLRIDGVKKVNIDGELKKEIKVTVDIDKLNNLSLSMNDIYNVLKAQNISMPQGNVHVDGEKIRISTNGTYESVEDIRNTVISVSNETGVVSKLSDIADINIDYIDDTPNYGSNGSNAVFISVYIKNNINGITVGKQITDQLEALKLNFPTGLKLENIFFGPDDVNKSLNNFLSNFYQGIALVVIVMLIGIGLRNALTISLSIPVTIFCTFIIMYVFNIKIDQMSLVGLIIGVGAIVDNSVVVGDAIQSSINAGTSIKKAAIRGPQLSAIAVLTATITTVLSFFPLTRIEGVVGHFIGPISVVFIITIIMSYVVAMFLIPSVASLVFKNTKKHSADEKIAARFISVFDVAFKYKKAIICAIVFVFVIVTVFLIPRVEFFPYADKDFFLIDINTEKKGDLAETEALVSKTIALLNTETEAVDIYSAAGAGLPKFFVTSIPKSESADTAQLFYRFNLTKRGEFRNQAEYQAYLQRRLTESIAGAKFEVVRLALSIPGAEIEIRLSGDDIETLKQARNRLKSEMSTLKGLTNLDDNMGDDTYHYQVTINDSKSMQMGFTKYDIQQQIYLAMRGAVPGVFSKDAKEFDIMLKSNITSVSELEKLKIKSSMTGNKVLLKEIAKIEQVLDTNVINTYKNKKTVTITANSLPGYSATDLTNEIDKSILSKMDLNGIEVSFDGERANIIKYFSNALTLALVSILLIYIVLCLQFKSFVLPLIIVFTIPLAVMGSLTGLFVMGNPLSLTALFGIIALSGVVVNNGILLIEYILIAKQEGESITSACRQSVSRRIKPIMLTAITTILGFAPLALSNNSLFSPMAIALMGGLIFSTFTTMFVIPILYSMIIKK